jgi:hypothetical protein
MPAAKIPSAMGSGIYRLFQPTQLTTPQLSYLSRGWNGLFTKNGTGFEAIAWESNTHTHTFHAFLRFMIRNQWIPWSHVIIAGLSNTNLDCHQLRHAIISAVPFEAQLNRPSTQY